MLEKTFYEDLEQKVRHLTKELSKKESDLLEIQKLASIGNWEWNIEQQILIWSDEVYRIFGFEPALFKPTVESFEAAIHPDDIKSFLNQREIMLNEKKISCIDHRIVRPDGEIRYVQECTQLIFNDQGEVCRVIGTVQDITNRKQIEEVLKNSESKYRAIFDNSLEAILLTAQDGSIFAANPAACDMLEMSEAEIISGGRNALVNLNDSRLQDALEERKKTGKFRGELSYRKKGGAIFPVEVSSAVFKNNNGNEMTCMFIRDITERKKSEEELTNYRDHLAELVEIRTFELEQENNKCRLIEKLLKETNDKLQQKTIALEDINTALKVLLHKREQDIKEIEERIFYNYETMIVPFLNKLKNGYSNVNQQNLIDILKTNLKEITSPFSKKLSDPIINLTPTEIQIVAFIKQGLSNKEIGLTLNCSVRTIDAHRDNIRKKLNLKNKKINLRSFLMNL